MILNKSQYVCLSYFLSSDLPFYKGKRIKLETKIKENEGKYNQETQFEIDSHVGTHLDFPSHFYKDGDNGEVYPPEHFMMSNIAFVEIDGWKEKRINRTHIPKNFDSETEILILKTGFCDVRHEDQYWKASPVIEHSLANDLRGIFPKLRMIGFDMISLTSQMDREEGRLAHLNFLDQSKGEILILEDMDLRKMHTGLNIKQMIVAPLYFEKMDGAPCTVWAQVEEKN